MNKFVSSIKEFIHRKYLLNGLILIFEADKGYGSEELRDKSLKRKIFHFLSYRRIDAAKKLRKSVVT